MEADLGVAVQVPPPGDNVFFDPRHPRCVPGDGRRLTARGRARPQQRSRVRTRRRPADGVRARLRLRSEHVALRGSGVRGRPSRRAVRSRRRGRLGSERVRPGAVRHARRLRRRRGRDLPRARPRGRGLRRPLGELDDRRARGGEGAGVHRRARARRPVAALHRRRGLRRRVHPGRHRGAAGVDGLELPRLVERDGARDHGQPGPARARRGADRELLPHRPGDRRASRG